MPKTLTTMVLERRGRELKRKALGATVIGVRKPNGGHRACFKRNKGDLEDVEIRSGEYG
jgi:hypothetical protein